MPRKGSFSSRWGRTYLTYRDPPCAIPEQMISFRQRCHRGLDGLWLGTRWLKHIFQAAILLLSTVEKCQEELRNYQRIRSERERHM